MQRLITVTADDDPQKPDFMFRLGELYAEKQRYNFNAGARARPEDLRAAAEPARPAAARSRRATSRRSRSGCSRRSRPTSARPSSASTSAWTRCCSASPTCSQREEGRPGARVLPPPDQGLPELEVHPGRVPVVRRVLLRQGRDGERPQVLREGRAVPEVERLPLRRLQEGLVLHQPGRLQDRARDLRRRRPHDPGGEGQRPQEAATRPRARRPRRTSSRPTRTSAAPTRPGSSSSRPAATSPRR